MADPDILSFSGPERESYSDGARTIGRAAAVFAELFQKFDVHLSPAEITARFANIYPDGVSPELEAVAYTLTDMIDSAAGQAHPDLRAAAKHRDGEVPSEHLFGHILSASELAILADLAPVQGEHFLYLIWPLFFAHRGMKSFVDTARVRAMLRYPAASLKRLGISSLSLAPVIELLQDEQPAVRQALQDTIQTDPKALRQLDPMIAEGVYGDVPVPERGTAAYDRAVRTLQTIFGDSLSRGQIMSLLELPADDQRRRHFLNGFETLYATDKDHANGSFAAIQRLYLEGALRGIDLQKTAALLGEATLDIEQRRLAPRKDLVVLLFENSLRGQPTAPEMPPENSNDSVPVESLLHGEGHPLMSPESDSERKLFLDVVSIVFYKDPPHRLKHQVNVLYTYLMVAHGQIEQVDEPDLREMKIAIEDLWDLLQRARPEYSDEVMNRARLIESLLKQPRTVINDHIKQRIDNDHPPAQRQKVFKHAMEQVDRQIIMSLQEVLAYTHAMREGREWPNDVK